MRISVGPAPSHWGATRLHALYRELAQSPVDYVYLGETACLSRSCLSPEVFGAFHDELERAGKVVYASSLVLVTGEEERRVFDLLAQRSGRIEINSPAFLGLARDYLAVVGAFLNVCNAAAADTLTRHRVERIVLPCELDLEAIASITRRCAARTEVIVHGHVPLAISRTCLTARALGRNGAGCRRACQRYPQGMVLEAGDRPMFRIEGPRTLSAATHCLVEHLEPLEQAGVDTVRILPQWEHTGRIVRIYRDVLDRRRGSRDALEELRTLSPDGLCNGWSLGKAGWRYESPN